LAAGFGAIVGLGTGMAWTKQTDAKMKARMDLVNILGGYGEVYARLGISSLRF